MLIMQLAQHGKVIWSSESHINATMEADKTFYLYLIQFLKFFCCIYLKISLYGCIKQVPMCMSGQFEGCSSYICFTKTFSKWKKL